MYINLAKETGGMIYSGNQEQVGNVFNNIEYEIRPDFVNILRSRLTIDDSVTVQVPVDDTLETVIFSATTYDGDITSTEVTQPDGTMIDSSSPNTSISQLGTNKIITVLGPSAGIWEIKVQGSGPVTISVKGNSLININHFQFVSTVAGRYEYQFVEISGGNPVYDGQPATVLTRLEGTVTDFSFSIVNETGVPIPAPVGVDTDSPKATSDELVLSFLPPIQPFGVAVTGTTAAGYVYRRLALREYVPRTIKVSFDESTRPISLPDGQNTTVQFVVENFGTVPVVLDIDVTDNLMYLASFVPTQVTLNGNSSAAINATLSPPVNCTKDIVSVTATVTVVGEIFGNSDTVDLNEVCVKEEMIPSAVSLKLPVVTHSIL